MSKRKPRESNAEYDFRHQVAGYERHRVMLRGIIAQRDAEIARLRAKLTSICEIVLCEFAVDQDYAGIDYITLQISRETWRELRVLCEQPVSNADELLTRKRMPINSKVLEERKPPPPGILLDALQDVVHKDVGRSRRLMRPEKYEELRTVAKWVVTCWHARNANLGDAPFIEAINRLEKIIYEDTPKSENTT